METEVAAWWKIFASGKKQLRLFSCVRAWHYVTLRKKKRFIGLAKRRDQLAVDFIESDVPLHAAVVFLYNSNVDAKPVLTQYEFMQVVAAVLTTASQCIDTHKRIALFYALELPWKNLDELLWLVAKSRWMLMNKDKEGRNVVTHAVMHGCAEEIQVLLAVEIVREAIELTTKMLQERQFETAKRLCVRIVDEYLAGVPHYPHAYSREVMRQHRDPFAMVQDLQAVWTEFVGTWGYHGTPFIDDDLPLVKYAPLNSCVQLKIHAKGEPLEYEWFLNQERIDGADQSTLFVSQRVQGFNAGTYQCIVKNWKGQATSSEMRLLVVDNSQGPDRALLYLLDRSMLSVEDEGCITHVAANSGALIVHSVPVVSLLIPPMSFQSINHLGQDVSNSMGMEVLLRVLPPTTLGDLRFHRDDWLVSPVIEVLPFTVPVLDKPVVLSIAHHWCPTDSLYELVVVEWPSPDSTSFNAQRQGVAYTEVAKKWIISTTRAFIMFEISRFTRYAVVARSLTPSTSLGAATPIAPLEKIFVVVVHPRHVSSQRQNEPSNVALWLILNRADGIDAIDTVIIPSFATNCNISQQDVTTTTYPVNIRQNQWLVFQLGSQHTISHQWTGISLGASNLCVQERFDILPTELQLDRESRDTDQVSLIFRVLEMRVILQKSSIATRIQSQQSIFEATWKALIVVVHDENKSVITTPTMHQRRPNQLALAYASHSNPTHMRHHQSILFDDIREAEREFSPYFYRVELARFSDTFWERYDQTWWFDKTHEPVLLGMYKTVHAGHDLFTVLATDAYAGAIRVVQCSIDTTSEYSEPFLLEPVTTPGFAFISSDTLEKLQEGEIDQHSKVPLGLRHKLTIPPTADHSVEIHESIQRLEHVLDTIYRPRSTDMFQQLYGVECQVDVVLKILEQRRNRYPAAHLESALLLMGFRELKKRIITSLRASRRFYTVLVYRFTLLERLIPEMDCFPTEFFQVNMELHVLLQDFFHILFNVSSVGWFQHVILNQTFEVDLRNVFSRACRLLETIANPLQGSNELLRTVFQEFMADGACPGLILEQHLMEQMRNYALLTIGPSIQHSTVETTCLINKHLWYVAKRSQSENVQDQVGFKSFEMELQSPTTTEALNKLHHSDSLESHIRGISPSNHERCTVLPQCIDIRFDLHIQSVNALQVIKVINTTHQCPLQGLVEYDRLEKRLRFTPSVPFELHTRYRIKLRAQDVTTSMGALHPSIVTYEFITVS